MKNNILLFCFLTVLSLSSCHSQVPGITIVSPKQAEKDLQQDTTIQLLDVRTSDEYREGHIKNSTNYCVTTNEFVDKMTRLDKEKPVYVYCRSGNRSAKATKILKENGFQKIFEIEGGIISWQQEGLSVEQ